MGKKKFLLFLALIYFENVINLSVPCNNMTWNNNTFDCSLQRYELINYSIRCNNMIMDNDTLVFAHNNLKVNIYNFAFSLHTYIGDN